MYKCRQSFNSSTGRRFTITQLISTGEFFFLNAQERTNFEKEEEPEIITPTLNTRSVWDDFDVFSSDNSSSTDNYSNNDSSSFDGFGGGDSGGGGASSSWD